MTAPTLIFLLVSNEICYGIQLILKALMESSSSEKILLKPLEVIIFQPNLWKNGVPMRCPKQKNIFFFFSEITKPDHNLSKPFYFNKISYVLAKL